MSDFRELQQIYENAWRVGPNQGRFFTGNQSSISMSQNPGTLPAQGPGGKVNSYAMNVGNSSTMPAEMEEELQDKLVSSREIIEMINALAEESDNQEMSHAVFQLGKLKDFISDLVKKS
jgi:hypothetical protein